MEIQFDNNNNIIEFILRDTSTGAPKTGLLFSSAGLIISTKTDNEASAINYTQAGSTIETITTLGTYAAPTVNKCRFKEVDATNLPGLYQFQFTDTRFSVSSSRKLNIVVSGASCYGAYEIVLTGYDPYGQPLTAQDFRNAMTLAETAGTPADGSIDNYLLGSISRTNIAQAGASGSITLDPGASAVDNYYTNDLVFIISGAGAGQSRFISAYTGASRIAAVAPNWSTPPDGTSKFFIIPFGSIAGATVPTAAQNAAAVWNDLLASADFSTAGSIGALLKADIDAAISSRLAPGGTLANVTTVGTVNIVGDKTNYGLSAGERTTLINSLLDATDAIEGGVTMRSAFKLMLAALAGQLTGAGTTTISIKNAVANNKTRIQATVDTNGNRTAFTFDLT